MKYQILYDVHILVWCISVCTWLEYVYSNNGNIVGRKRAKKISFLFFECLMIGGRREKISKHVLPGEVFQGIYTGALACTHARTHAETHVYTTSSSVPNLWQYVFFFLQFTHEFGSYRKTLGQILPITSIDALRCV